MDIEKRITRLLSEFYEVHGDKYDYDFSGFKTRKDKIRIYCNIHEEWFIQQVATHLIGSGCKKCAYESVSKKNAMTHDEFVSKASSIHGVDRYLYIGKYVRNAEKIAILCRHHGIFYQTPNSHISGQGCSECGRDRVIKARKYTNSDFIKNATERHGDRYDYSLVDYINSRAKVTIICKSHGVFSQLPSDHLKGVGCKYCGFEHSRGGYRIETLNDDDKKKPSTLYHIKLYRDEEYICDKVGVTVRSLEDRFKRIKQTEIEYKVLCVSHGDLIEVLKKEQDILNYLESKGKRYKAHYLKDTPVGGWTECFYADKETDAYLEDVFANHDSKNKISVML